MTSKLYNMLLGYTPSEKENMITWNSLSSNIDFLEKYHRAFLIFLVFDYATANKMPLDKAPFGIISYKNGKPVKDSMEGDSALIPDTIPNELKNVLRKYVHLVTTLKLIK